MSQSSATVEPDIYPNDSGANEMIFLNDELKQEIEAHGVRDFPNECCGVLIGEFKNGVKTVHEVRPLPNSFAPSEEFEKSVLSEPNETSEVSVVGQERRYMVSSDTMFQLMREERKTGNKILGFYHSHPNHPARPSEYDREWAWPWYSYIILSVMQGTPAEMNSWLLDEDRTAYTAEEIVVSE